MCLAIRYDDAKTKEILDKKSDPMEMWRIFEQKWDGELYSVIVKCHFPRNGGKHICTPCSDHGVNGLGFHCFLTQKDAIAIMKAWSETFFPSETLTIRNVLVEKSDIVALGETTWCFDYSPPPTGITHTTQTAIVQAFVISEQLE